MIPEAYFTVIDYGPRGRESIINWERCSKADLIADILSGEVEPNMIGGLFHLIPSEGTCRDVTEDLAREIATKHLDETPSYELLTFLEQHLGCAFMADVVRELAA